MAEERRDLKKNYEVRLFCASLVSGMRIKPAGRKIRLETPIDESGTAVIASSIGIAPKVRFGAL